MKISDQLEAVSALLLKGWTQRTWARDSYGMSILYNHPQAVYFCLDGAILKVIPDLPKSRRFISKALPDNTFAAPWNDDPDRTQEEVVAVVKKAAQLAREEEGE